MMSTSAAELVRERTDTFVAFLRTLPEDGLRQRQQGAWSVLEVLEHLWMVEKLALRARREPLVAVSGEGSGEVHAVGEEKIARAMQSARLFEAPEAVRPKGRYDHLEAWVTEWLPQREALAAGFEQAPMAAVTAFQHPAFGMMSGHDWLVFAVAHTDRHIRQVYRMTGSVCPF